MSLELFAFSHDPAPVSVSGLADRCLLRGYDCRVIRHTTTLITQGELAAKDTILGWRRSRLSSRAAAKAVESVDWGKIGLLGGREKVGACVLDIRNDPARFTSAQSAEQHAESAAEKYADYRKQSKIQWSIKLAGGRNFLSIELADCVLRSVLELRGGLLDDPHSKKFDFVEPRADAR